MDSSTGSSMTDEELIFLRGYMEEKLGGGPHHEEVDRHGGDHLAILQFFHFALSEGIGEVSMPAMPQPWPWKDVADMKSRQDAVRESRAKRST